MSGFSGFGNSPIKQDDKRKCYINEKGESVCPYAPLAPMTDEEKKKIIERQKNQPDIKKVMDQMKKKGGVNSKK